MNVDITTITNLVVSAPTTHASYWHAAGTKPTATKRARVFGYPSGFRPHLDHRSWVIV